MSEPQIPERLRLVGDHDFERQLLDAAAAEQPSAELSSRMAKAIGISFVAPGPAGTATAVKTGAAVAKSSTGTVALWSLVAAGVVAVAATALVLATRSSPAPVTAPPTIPRAVTATPAPEIAPAPADEPASAGDGAPAPSASPVRRSRSGSSTDLRSQIVLLDAARAALATKSYDHALDLLHRYRERYPNGSFRPEAAALTVEALVSAGRVSEARALARRFVAEFGPSPLAERVQRQAGLSAP